MITSARAMTHPGGQTQRRARRGMRISLDLAHGLSLLCSLVVLSSSLSLMAVALEDLGEEIETTPGLLSPINDSDWKDGEEPEFFSSEQRLMQNLVGHYENSVRPVFNASDPVDVKLGLTLTQILDLDEKNQVLTTNVWLEAEWFDERLRWNSSDFAGITSIRIPCERIWLPDIVLYNSVDDYTSGYMPSLAMVYNDSRVFWGPVIRFRSSCKIDITYFPFDDQVCRLKLGSWAYNGYQVNVWNRSDTMDLSNFVDNGEWELMAVKVRRNVVTYNCCDEPFPDVTFFVHLRRRIKYYFMNIIIPCIILSCLCLAGFLLPPESGEKITLGLSVLLTITVFMLMVADKMPQTSESISVISIYLMVVLATSCLSVLSSVLVLSIHHQRGRPRRVPGWLRYVVFRVVARLVCVRTYTYHYRYSASTSSSSSASSRDKRRQQSVARHKERKVPRSPRRGRVATEERECLNMQYRSKPAPGAGPPSTQPLLPPAAAAAPAAALAPRAFLSPLAAWSPATERSGQASADTARPVVGGSSDGGSDGLAKGTDAGKSRDLSACQRFPRRGRNAGYGDQNVSSAGYGGGRSTGYGGDRNTGYGGDRNTGYGYQKSGYGGDQSTGYSYHKSGYSDDQKIGYGGDQNTGYGDQKIGYGDQNTGYGDQKTGYGGNKNTGYGGDQNTGYGGDQNTGYGDHNTTKHRSGSETEAACLSKTSGVDKTRTAETDSDTARSEKSRELSTPTRSHASTRENDGLSSSNRHSDRHAQQRHVSESTYRSGKENTFCWKRESASNPDRDRGDDAYVSSGENAARDSAFSPSRENSRSRESARHADSALKAAEEEESTGRVSVQDAERERESTENVLGGNTEERLSASPENSAQNTPGRSQNSQTAPGPKGPGAEGKGDTETTARGGALNDGGSGAATQSRQRAGRGNTNTNTNTKPPQAPADNANANTSNNNTPAPDYGGHCPGYPPGPLAADAAIVQRLITFIQAKHSDELKDDEVYREWHDVACVLDRLLFYVFLVITVVSTVTILEMRPSNVDF